MLVVKLKMSLVTRKPMFCICEYKDTDQLRGNPEADQRLCFRFTDSKIPLLSKSKIGSPSIASYNYYSTIFINLQIKSIFFNWQMTPIFALKGQLFRHQS